MNKGNSRLLYLHAKAKLILILPRTIMVEDVMLSENRASIKRAFLFKSQQHHYEKRVMIMYGRVGVHLSKVIYEEHQIDAASKNVERSYEILND